MVTNNEAKMEFNWNSKELDEAVIKQTGNFFKAEKGKIYLIEIDKTKPVIDRGVVEIGGKLQRKFDLHIKCDGKELIWSVGKQNLELFNKATTNKFNILLTSDKYNIIPIL